MLQKDLMDRYDLDEGGSFVFKNHSSGLIVSPPLMMMHQDTAVKRSASASKNIFYFPISLTLSKNTIFYLPFCRLLGNLWIYLLRSKSAVQVQG